MKVYRAFNWLKKKNTIYKHFNNQIIRFYLQLGCNINLGKLFLKKLNILGWKNNLPECPPIHKKTMLFDIHFFVLFL